jgi:NADPH:quinone reductase-like Zn-dependent oxidoreductase
VRAAVHERYGAPARVVEVRELEKPEPGPGEVLVRIRAASVNIADWYAVTGRPLIARGSMGLRGPKETRIGVDYSGVIEAVGGDVTDFEAGDEVFGGRNGACGEYVVAKADRAIVTKPATATFEHAAAVGVAATTALQAIRDQGKLQEGQRVLVHGASGGVGTYAVQIAKALGGEVTAVCGPRGVEIARALGADRVVDHTQEDVTRSDERFDLAVDIAGTRSFRELRRVLAPNATLVVVGGKRASRLLGPLGHVAGCKFGAIFATQRATFFIAKLNKADMETLRELLDAGKLTSVVDDVFPFERVADALEHMGAGHPRGKIVVTVAGA